RKRHPIPLETRREHKYVGCQIQFDDTLRWDGAEHRDPVAETVGRDIGVEPRSGGHVAGPVTSDGQPPGQVGNLATAAINRSYPLPGTTDPIERSRTTALLLPSAGGTESLPGRTTLMR